MTATSAVRTFAVDKVHSEVEFQVRHLVTKVRGKFTDFSGTVAFDAERPDASSVSFSVNTASIDTSAAPHAPATADALPPPGVGSADANREANSSRLRCLTSPPSPMRSARPRVPA